MRPTTVVSYANLMKRLELVDGVQSWVSRVKRRGLSTHPWGGPCVQCDGAGCVYCRPILPEVSRSESPTASCTERCWAPAGPIYEWAVEGWLCWMLNWSLWTAIWQTSPFCPDVWGLGGGQWWWHHRSSGWTYMQVELEGVQWGGEDRLDVLHD